MRSNILTIIRKEFARFFGDKTLVFFTLLFPGILIFGIYSFIGAGLDDLLTPDDTPPVVYVVNLPTDIEPVLPAFGLSKINHAEPWQVESVKQSIVSRDVHLLVIFPENFETDVAGFANRPPNAPVPDIMMFFNSIESNSIFAFQNMSMLLEAYHSEFANVFNINSGVQSPDLAPPAELSASMLAMMMPMLLMIMLHSGVAGVAPESIAGEKERGTIATLLVTPLKRSELAIGKILSLASLAFLSGIITAVFTILSMPNLLGAQDMQLGQIYSMRDYIFLLGIVLSTVILKVTLVSITSALSKSVKQAGTAGTPLMIIVMLIAFMGMFGFGDAENTALFLIPLFNSMQSMSGIFALNYEPVNIIVTIISNLVYACLGAFVLARMFNSERVMFSK